MYLLKSLPLFSTIQSLICIYVLWWCCALIPNLFANRPKTCNYIFIAICKNQARTWFAIRMQFVIDFLIKSAKMACVDVFLGCLLKCMDNQKKQPVILVFFVISSHHPSHRILCDYYGKLVMR